MKKESPFPRIEALGLKIYKGLTIDYVLTKDLERVLGDKKEKFWQLFGEQTMSEAGPYASESWAY